MAASPPSLDSAVVNPKRVEYSLAGLACSTSTVVCSHAYTSMRCNYAHSPGSGLAQCQLTCLCVQWTSQTLQPKQPCSLGYMGLGIQTSPAKHNTILLHKLVSCQLLHHTSWASKKINAAHCVMLTVHFNNEGTFIIGHIDTHVSSSRRCRGRYCWHLPLLFCSAALRQTTQNCIQHHVLPIGAADLHPPFTAIPCQA